MSKTRPPYPEEFRREAIALVRSPGEPIPRIAKGLGCTPETLRNLNKRAEVDLGERPGVSTEETQELRELSRAACCGRWQCQARGGSDWPPARNGTARGSPRLSAARPRGRAARFVR